MLDTRAAAVQLMGFDVDGTLTDGGLYFGPDGEAFKRFCVFDGQGLRQLIASGVQVAWITARQSDIVARRAADLGISNVVQACQDKRAALNTLRQSLNLTWAQCGFFGDDWPDATLLRQVGWAATTATAPLAMRADAHWLAKRPAGHGAVREVCDYLLHQRQRMVSSP